MPPTNYRDATTVQDALDELTHHVRAIDSASGTLWTIAYTYEFSTTTANADPGDGTVRLSNATQSLSTTLRVDDVDAGGRTVTSLIDQTDGLYVRIQHRTDRSKWIEASVSAASVQSGWRNLTIAVSDSSAASPFADGDPIRLVFAEAPPADWLVWHLPKRNATTADPTTGDDAGDGYDVGSRWINTSSGNEFVCVDATVGAAVWESTTASGGLGAGQYASRRLVATSDGAAATITLNSSAYVDVFSLSFYHDWDFFPATHFAITCVACSNAAGQTISVQLAPFGSPTNPVSSGGNDLVIPNNGGVTQPLSSGWIAVSDSMSGFLHMEAALKGSNATVDLTVRMVEILLKIDP